MPGLLAVLVGHPGPDIQHRLAGHLHAERRATFLRVLEQGGEGVLDGLELKVEIALNLHRRLLGRGNG
ncbi:hypothetical protein D3C71_2127470 [compost metagenome]